jgi:hypothetical protein
MSTQPRADDLAEHHRTNRHIRTWTPRIAIANARASARSAPAAGRAAAAGGAAARADGTVQVGTGPAAEVSATADADGDESGRFVLGRRRHLLWFLCDRVIFGAQRPVFPFRHFASFNLAVHRLIGTSAPILMPAHTQSPRC